MDPHSPLALKSRDQALLMISLLLERDEAKALFDFLPPARREVLRRYGERLQEMPGKKRIALALERLKSLMDPSFFEDIEEVHPGWMAAHLEEQPLQLAGMALKSLPPRYIPKVVQAMRPEKVARIQKEMHGVNPTDFQKELLLAVLVRDFRLINCLSGVSQDPFEMIYYLNGQELLVLMEELGVAELAMACQDLSAEDFHSIAGKLPPKMQEKIKIKLGQYERTPPERVKQARHSFLHLQDELYEKGRLIEFTGLGIMARALVGAPPERIDFVAHKLPPREGGVLLKMVRRLGGEADAEQASVTRPEVVEKITYLAEIDRIRSLWKYF
jgi:hypothetical protein